MIICDKCKKEKAYEYKFSVEDIRANVLILTKTVHYCERCVQLILIDLGVKDFTLIEDIGPWDIRLRKFFIKNNIKYVEELILFTANDIHKNKNIGVTMLNIIRNNLRKVNLSLKDEE